MTPRRLGLLAPLRLPVLALLATLAAGLLLDYASAHYANGMEEAQAQLEHQLDAIRIRQMQARNRGASFRVDAATYQRLAQQGLVGPEQRLAWIALLRRLSTLHGLGRNDYQLAAQRPYAVLASDEGRDLHLSATRVTLALEAPHELRLLAFLDDLAAQAPGLMLGRSCQLEVGRGANALVSARCSLDWVTLEP